MVVAVVDVGTNSTRLLIAEVQQERVVRELERRTNVTRLGDGVDTTGRLSDEAVQRVLQVCAAYREAIDARGAKRVVAVLTSAVRDAENGPEFEAALRERFGFEAATISGEQEARLTFLGATTVRSHPEPLMVLDIGGGSTEIVVGRRGEVGFFVSTQIGSVRHTERFLRADPPSSDELAACRAAVGEALAAAVPQAVRTLPAAGVAVAGTPTSFAAIDLELEPYDRERVDGHRLSLDRCEGILGRLAQMPVAERRSVRGLHPDRAPTIVAGGIILVETMVLFGLTEIEVSEHDILDGAAIEAAETAEKHAQ
jgi:exopolyphosphatase/guanosine-5'-triphosphate,3'-diphosphate pyrophosphatase